MDGILEWGISVIQMVQTARSPLLDGFFKAMTELGSEYFYFAAIPIICTMVNRTIGLRIALTILASVAINSLIKTWVGEPRPFELVPSLGLVPESGFGFPSGHTQQATLFWGLVYFYSRKWWVALLGATFVGLVGLSRIYLGVHYPTDVLGGLLIAGLVLFAHQSAVKYGGNWWRSPTRFFIFAAVLVLAIVGCLVAPAKDMFSSMGLGSGLLAGILIVSDLPSLAPNLIKRVMTAGITAVVLLACFAGLKLLFPKSGEPHYEFFSFVRYFLCGFNLSCVPLWLDLRDQRRQLF